MTDVPLVPRPLTEAEALAVLRADVEALRVPDVALYTLHREQGSPVPMNGIEGREAEMRTLVQQYYDRGGRLSEAEQATVDMFAMTACQADIIRDFCGDPAHGPSLKRLYPDMTVDVVSQAQIRRARRSSALRRLKRLRGRWWRV